VLANAAHIKNVPGRKTDVADATWIADLLAHGLIRGSFVPPTPIQDLRALMRTRKQLVREAARNTQRIQSIRCTSPVSRRRRDGIKLATWPPPRTRQSAEFVAPCCSVAAVAIGGGTRRGPHSHRSCSGSRRTRVVAQYLGASSR